MGIGLQSRTANRGNHYDQIAEVLREHNVLLDHQGDAVHNLLITPLDDDPYRWFAINGLLKSLGAM